MATPQEAAATLDSEAPEAADVTLEKARSELRRTTRQNALMLLSSGAVNLAAGLPLFLRAETDVWVPGDLGGTMKTLPREARKQGAGIALLGLGIGGIVGGLTGLLSMIRLRTDEDVRAVLRERRSLGKRRVRLALGLSGLALSLVGGLMTYGIASDPVMQGFGLGMAANAVSFAIALPISLRHERQLRPYYPLGDVAVGEP